MHPKNILFVLILGALTACQQSGSTHDSQPETQTPTTNHQVADTIYPAEQVAQDTTLTYALFVPSSYHKKGDRPAIIFFDSHGAGIRPVSMYKDLAEQYGYILMGSNDSRNGVPMMTADLWARQLCLEAMTRFGVKSGDIALCGQSGGAKVALISGSRNPDVSTVIYCGAAEAIQPTHPLALVGFAGRRDMNYADMVQFNRSWNSTDMTHYLIEWPGPHEWPPVPAFLDAFMFLATGQIERYDQKKPSITEEQLQTEQAQKMKYYQAFQDKPLDWWKKEVAQLNAQEGTDPMYERLLGFISLACYTYTSRAIQKNDLATAERLLAIYEVADPGNSDIDKLRAEVEKRKQ